jgi:hypothetical protein
MRTFKCFDCQHTWQLPHGTGGRGVDLICPQCGSHNIHRAERDRGCSGGWRHGWLGRTDELSMPGQRRGGWRHRQA